jgi:glycosyltransferase involved in cell wall biosynthesis
MRVLNVTQTYFPFLEFGGPPVKVRALSQALARRGHQVTVLTSDWGFQQRSTPENGLMKSAKRAAFGWGWNEQGVEAVYLPSWLRHRALSWNPGVARFCRERLREFEIVHIFGVYDFLGPAVARFCRSLRVPYVVEPIGMFLPIVRSFFLKRMYHLLLGNRMLSRCSSIIATSRQELTELASAGPPSEKIVLRRNGVNVPDVMPERGSFRAARGISPDAKLVLFLGRLSQKKSPDLLLQTFAMLCAQKKIANLQLAFVGPDESGMECKLMRMAGELGVASCVKFCGALFGEAKWGAYRDADVFVLPSQNENFGNTAAEAVVAGTPVVVTEQCGIAPLLAEVAALVAAHDATSLSSAIERILSEPGLHMRLAAGCREAAARLDWEEPAAEMEALYRRLAPVAERHALYMRA